jgi:hypothetical protein
MGIASWRFGRPKFKKNQNIYLVDHSEGHPDQGQHAEEEVEREFWMLLPWLLETVDHLFFL